MDTGTATVLAAAFGSLATIIVAGIGAFVTLRTSETRAENDRLRAENQALKGGGSDEA